jgi:hypothetical protein
MYFSYWDEQGGGVGGGNKDGNFLAFLRSEQSTRVEPGSSESWLLELDSQNLHQGRANLGIRGPVYGTTNLDLNHITTYEFETKISVKLRKVDRCFAVGGG